MSPFYNDRVFGTREELMDWVQSTARNLGYVIVTQRTKKTVIGFVNKVYLMCDRGGEYKSRSQSTTHSGTKKCGCPFQLIAKYNHNPTHSGWNINVICDEHNHDPAIFLEGHAFAKRFSKKEFEIVKDMTNKNMVPRDILTQLKKNDDQNVSTTQTVYDARQKIRKAERVGQTPMQNRKWLRSKLIDKQDVFTYLDANWLQKYKEKFVSAWIDQNLNFGERTTNRVESQHSLLKIHLDNERSHLDKFVGIIDDIVRIQYTEIKASFEESMNKIKHLHRNRTFSLLLTKVSIETIDVLTGEMHRVKSLKQKEESCGCQIRTSCGLPCACEISQYVDVDLSIPLHMINVFWKKLDFEPALLNQEEPNEPDDPDTDIREQLHDFEEAYNNKNRAVVKKSWLQKIKAIWDPSSTSCGFRATASALGYGEDQWLLIRRLLIDEMVQFETHYKKAFKDEYNEVFSSLEWSGPGFAPHEYWMIMPETGFLIANRFNVVCHFISTEGNNSSTLFPLWRGPDQFPDKKIITIALVNSNHYVMVEMQDEFPMSLTHNLWRLRRERDATGWKNIFKSRQKFYKDWVAKPAKYEVID